MTASTTFAGEPPGALFIEAEPLLSKLNIKYTNLIFFCQQFFKKYQNYIKKIASTSDQKILKRDIFSRRLIPFPYIPAISTV